MTLAFPRLVAALLLTGCGLIITTGCALLNDKTYERLSATLRASDDLHRLGDRNAIGMVDLRLLKPRPGLSGVLAPLCYRLLVADTQPPFAAHLHRRFGASDVITISFRVPNPESSGCLDVSGSRLREMLVHPERFYVDVHTAAFPSGALIGYLDKSEPVGSPAASPNSSGKGK